MGWEETWLLVVFSLLHGETGVWLVCSVVSWPAEVSVSEGQQGKEIQGNSLLIHSEGISFAALLCPSILFRGKRV